MQKYNILELNEKLLPELQSIAEELGIKKVSSLKKEELVYRILDEQAISYAGIQAEKMKEKEAKKPVEGRKRGRPAKAASLPHPRRKQRLSASYSGIRTLIPYWIKFSRSPFRNPRLTNLNPRPLPSRIILDRTIDRIIIITTVITITLITTSRLKRKCMSLMASLQEPAC